MRHGSWRMECTQDDAAVASKGGEWGANRGPELERTSWVAHAVVLDPKLLDRCEIEHVIAVEVSADPPGHHVAFEQGFGLERPAALGCHILDVPMNL